MEVPRALSLTSHLCLQTKVSARTELRAPLRLARLFASGGLAAGAGLGLIIITGRLVSSLRGAPQGAFQAVKPDTDGRCAALVILLHVFVCAHGCCVRRADFHTGSKQGLQDMARMKRHAQFQVCAPACPTCLLLLQAALTRRT